MNKHFNIGHEPAEKALLAHFEASDLLGTPFPVYLENAVTEQRDPDTGSVTGYAIPNPDELNAIVALLRANNPIKLNGQEIRYLRRSLGWRAVRLAKELRIQPEVLSRYENDKNAIGEVYEQLLRAFVFISHKDVAPYIGFDIKDFLDLKVKCARNVSEKVAINLVRVETDEDDPHHHLKWRVAGLDAPAPRYAGGRC